MDLDRKKVICLSCLNGFRYVNVFVNQREDVPGQSGLGDGGKALDISYLQDRLPGINSSLEMVLGFVAGTEETLQQLMEAQVEVRSNV